MDDLSTEMILHFFLKRLFGLGKHRPNSLYMVRFSSVAYLVFLLELVLSDMAAWGTLGSVNTKYEIQMCINTPAQVRFNDHGGIISEVWLSGRGCSWILIFHVTVWWLTVTFCLTRLHISTLTPIYQRITGERMTEGNLLISWTLFLRLIWICLWPPSQKFKCGKTTSPSLIYCKRISRQESNTMQVILHSKETGNPLACFYVVNFC